MEKAREEADMIENLAGKNSSKEDIVTAEIIVDEDNNKKREAVRRVITKLREELKFLVGKGILVINLENLDQSSLSPEERADILIDAMPGDIAGVRDYLHSEGGMEIVTEKPGPRDGYFFYLRLKP